MNKTNIIIFVILVIAISGCVSKSKAVISIANNAEDKRVSLADEQLDPIEIRSFSEGIIEFNADVGNYSVILSNKKGIPLKIVSINLEKGKIISVLFMKVDENFNESPEFSLKMFILNSNISFKDTSSGTWQASEEYLTEDDYKDIKDAVTESLVDKIKRYMFKHK